MNINVDECEDQVVISNNKIISDNSSGSDPSAGVCGTNATNLVHVPSFPYTPAPFKLPRPYHHPLDDETILPPPHPPPAMATSMEDIEDDDWEFPSRPPHLPEDVTPATPRFFDYQEYFPELSVFLDNLEKIQEELRQATSCPVGIYTVLYHGVCSLYITHIELYSGLLGRKKH